MDDILKIKVKSVIEEANIYFRNIIETSQAHGICEHTLNIRNGKKGWQQERQQKRQQELKTITRGSSKTKKSHVFTCFSSFYLNDHEVLPQFSCKQLNKITKLN